MQRDGDAVSMDVSEQTTARANNTMWDEVTGLINPSFVPKVKSLRDLVGCEVKNEPHDVAALLRLPWNERIATSVDKLATFLSEQDVLTFRQVGKLSDSIVERLQSHRRNGGLSGVTVGTFQNFLNLHNIFHALLLSKHRGKRERQ
jgi:hypothetical protein